MCFCGHHVDILQRCDIYLGKADDSYSARTFLINTDENGDLIFKASAANGIAVTSNGVIDKQKHFTWRFFPSQGVISVNVVGKLKFKLFWPAYNDRRTYETYRDKSIQAMDPNRLENMDSNVLNVQSKMNARLISSETTSKKENAWKAVGSLGYGGLGQVVLVKRIQDGLVRVCKHIDCKATVNWESGVKKELQSLLDECDHVSSALNEVLSAFTHKYRRILFDG